MRRAFSIPLTVGILLAWTALASGRGDAASARGAAVEDTPTRGSTMARVVDRHGEPRRRRGPVGEPPITRWDYEGFSVFFEHDRVLHAVVPGEPPSLHHRDELAAGNR